MKVTLITATYNSASTIRDCITSINNQTYENIEQIIIDGASIDNTIKIIKSMPNRVASIVSEPDRGIYDAMNKGINLASGSIIGILNSDDLLASDDIIEKIVKTFVQNECDGIYGNLDFVNSADVNKVVRRWKSSQYIKGSFVKGWHPSHPTFYLKSQIYKKYGNFDISLNISADFELMLRFIEKKQIKVHYLDETIVKMRYGGASTGSIKNIIIANINVMKAFKKNDILVSPFYPIFRILNKIKQFYKI